MPSQEATLDRMTLLGLCPAGICSRRTDNPDLHLSTGAL